jgi:hypothetical protein
MLKANRNAWYKSFVGRFQALLKSSLQTNVGRIWIVLDQSSTGLVLVSWVDSHFWIMFGLVDSYFWIMFGTFKRSLDKKKHMKTLNKNCGFRTTVANQYFKMSAMYSGATCTKLFPGHLCQCHAVSDCSKKVWIHKANLRQKT